MSVSYTATITYDLRGFQVRPDFSLLVQLVVKQDDTVIDKQQHEISVAASQAFWTSNPSGNKSRGADVQSGIFAMLKAQGSIPAEAT